MITLRDRFVVLLIVSLVLFIRPVLAQPQPVGKKTISITAREILARVDKTIGFNEPFAQAKLTYVTPKGKIRVFEVEIFHQDNHFLYRYKSISRGEVERVLTRFSGEKIWVYNVLSKILYHKQGIDKFRPILATDFFYFDLAGVLYQANYQAKILGKTMLKKRSCFKLELLPLYRSAVYGMLTMWVDDKKFIPLRIDYHDIDKVVFKSQTFVRIRENEKTGHIIPEKIDMLNISNGTLTTLEMVRYDPNKKLDSKLFFFENLNHP